MKLTFIFLLCLAYTYIRYALFGPTDISQWPAFLFNKSISFYAVMILCLSAWLYKNGELQQSKKMGRIVWHAAVIHIGLSLALLSPDYYKKFYDEDSLTLNGEFIMLFGVLAAYSFWQIPNFAKNLSVQYKIKLSACLLALGHIIPMGSSWLTPAAWHGGMPPVSLLSALLCVLAFVFMLKPQNN
jgi:hypothetical protein